MRDKIKQKIDHLNECLQDEREVDEQDELHIHCLEFAIEQLEELFK